MYLGFFAFTAERCSEWLLPDLEFGTKRSERVGNQLRVTYRCDDGYFFDHRGTSERTYTCTQGNAFTPSDVAFCQREFPFYFLVENLFRDHQLAEGVCQEAFVGFLRLG